MARCYLILTAYSVNEVDYITHIVDELLKLWD